MYRIIIILTLCLMMSSPVMAEDLYVCASNAGTSNGLSWATCFNGFSDISWGSGAGALGAGDTLYIDGGASGQTYTEQLTIGADGSSGNYIYIKTGVLSPSPTGHSGDVTINTADNYTTWTTLTAYVVGDLVVAPSGNHFRCKTAHTSGTWASDTAYWDAWGRGIWIGSSSFICVDGNDGAGGRNLILTGNAEPGVHIYAGTDNLIRYVESCSNGDGIKIEYVATSCHDRADPYSTNIFEHNYFHTNSSDAITIGACATGRYNIISKLHTTHSDGWEAYGGNSHGHLMVYANDFIGSGANGQFWGDPGAAAGPDYIINNIFRCDAGNAACTLDRAVRFKPDTDGAGGFEIYVWNNTFAYILKFPAVDLGGKGGSFNVIDVRNNLLYESSGDGGKAISIDADVGTPTITVDYNIIYGPVYAVDDIVHVKGTDYDCSGGSYATYNTHGNCNAVSLTGPVYGEAGNLTLTASDTNARDGGVDLSTQFTALGLSAVDKDGNTRSGTWDVGAYEYTSGSTPGSAKGWTLKGGESK